MLLSVGFLPLTIFSFLKRPFSPGPIFFSSLSALWQTPHCSKTSLPLAASPLPAANAPLEPTARVRQTANARNRYIFSTFSTGANLFILQRAPREREGGYVKTQARAFISRGPSAM